MTDQDAIGHRPATQDELPGFFELMVNQTAHYLKDALKTLDITVEQFEIYFRSVGQVWAVEIAGQVAGFYWIELRAEVLHIHALILRPEFQGQGIGTSILRLIEQCRPDGVTHLEVGVHNSNTRAQALCGKCGFALTRKRPEVGFAIYSKRWL